jgi:hypothetical protein
MKYLPGILALALLTASVEAQSPIPAPKTTPVPTATPAAKHGTLKYVPPKNLLAGTRHDVDAGTRGWTPHLPAVYVLAPNHTGLTTQAQPSLFWYQSGPSNTPFVLTIIEPMNPKPLLKVGIEKADQPGIHRISLERYHVRLTPGVLYKWTIALVPDPANRSQDLIASDMIQRIEPDARLAAALAGGKASEKAATYAGNGVWYDALEALTNEIDAAPADKDIRLLRVSLLEQAGLKAAAASDRR